MQRIVGGQADKVIAESRMQGLLSCTHPLPDPPQRGEPHLGVGEIPLRHRPAPAQLAAERAAQLGEAELIPGLAGDGRHHRAKVALAPAEPADRDQADEGAGKRTEQMFGAGEARTVEARYVGRIAVGHVAHQLADLFLVPQGAAGLDLGEEVRVDEVEVLRRQHQPEGVAPRGTIRVGAGEDGVDDLVLETAVVAGADGLDDGAGLGTIQGGN